MTNQIRVLFLLMLALIGAASMTSQTQDGVDILLAKARSLEARGRIDLAAENWHKVLLVSPNQTEALAGLARSAKENGQTNEERSYLDKLRSVSPHDPAINAVEKLRVFTPEERSRLDEAGRLAMQHKADDAMKIYRQVLGGEQPPLGKWAQPFYETEAASTGGKEIAISQLRQLCAQNPNQEVYRFWLASLLSYDQKTRRESFDMFQSIKDPGIVEQARDPWRQAILWEKQNPDALASMEAYLQRYHDSEIDPFAAALRVKQQQNLEDADREQGFKALRNKDVDAAERRFEDVLRQSPNDANAIAGLAFVRLDQKRFSEALSLFDRASKLDPKRQDVHDGYDSARFWLAVERGATAQQQNQPDAAVAAYNEALTIRPSDSGALLGLANALLKGKKFPDAEAKFRQVLNQSPNNADAMAGLGFVRLNEGNFDDAARMFAQARKLDPSRKDIDEGYRNANFWAIMSQAAAALKSGRPKEAVAAYRQAVALNANDKDALLGLANASMRADDYPTAAKTYYQLTASYPNDSANWLGLIQAQIGEKAPQAAISTSQQIPSALKQQMENSSDYVSEMAFLYYTADQTPMGDQTLQRALKLANTSDSPDALSWRMQIAGRFMDQGDIGRAVGIYLQATHSHPNDPAGWEGLIGAYTRVNNFSQAIAAVDSMPQHSYEAAMKNTGFLDSVAVLYSTQGQCVQAEDFLNRSIALDKTSGHEPAEGTQLQLADIWVRERNLDNARTLYHDLAARDANSAEAWRGYLAVLHKQHADGTMVAEIAHIPAKVRAQLESDSNFLVLEASAYSTAGRNQDALPLLQQARSLYTKRSEPPPINLDIQTAWTMLAISVDQPGFTEIVLADKRRTDLSAKQRDAVEELWSNRSVRRAEQTFASNQQAGISMLVDAGHEYPADRNINAALASLYLKRNEKEHALDVFRTWGMAGAQAGDFRVAAGIALSSHKNDMADQYLKRGLEQFPKDPQLMHMMARENIARGNYNEGEQELRSALVAVHEQNDAAPLSRPLALPSSYDDQDASSVESGNSRSAAASSSPSKSVPACRPETAKNPPKDAPAEARIQPIRLLLRVPHSRLVSDEDPQAVGNQSPQAASGQNSQAPNNQNPQGASGQSPAPSQSASPAPPTSTQPSSVQPAQQNQEEQMQDEVEAVDNRNTPVMSTGGLGIGRVGDPGLDRLIIFDSPLGSTYAVSNQVRFGVEAHGVYATSGSLDGTSGQMFGTLPAYATYGLGAQLGYSGLAQLSTKTFGMAAGTSPQGFPVHNLIGGIRFRPLNGMFTFQAVRDSVKDSLLSYAGAFDPGTGLHWGGVVSNTGTARFESTPASGDVYKRFGEYASGSYSYLQGANVPNNWDVAGNAGFYWQVVQGLTLGVNANAMHYNRNLNFFSFGQGGYFSPQQYELASIPISWYSRHPRFEYEVRFSGGIQHFEQDASPFYPVLPGAAAVTPGTYAPLSSTDPNYDAQVRLGYRVAPHVYFDIYATANNARNFYTQSLGFSLKFMTRSIPTSTDLHVDSIPDWTGKQPFSVR
jgi:tetratricopeptide (TPR) repeat protein